MEEKFRFSLYTRDVADAREKCQTSNSVETHRLGSVQLDMHSTIDGERFDVVTRKLESGRGTGGVQGQHCVVFVRVRALFAHLHFCGRTSARSLVARIAFASVIELSERAISSVARSAPLTPP